jgi:hypothetical protein
VCVCLAANGQIARVDPKADKGIDRVDFRNAQIDVSGTACSDNSRFSYISLKDGKFEFERYQFALSGDAKYGDVSGPENQPHAVSAVFVGSCTVEGRTAQILFFYGIDGSGTPLRLGAVDLTEADGALVRSFRVADGAVLVEREPGAGALPNVDSYWLLGGNLGGSPHPAGSGAALSGSSADGLSSFRGPRRARRHGTKAKKSRIKPDSDGEQSDLGDAEIAALGNEQLLPWPPLTPSSLGDITALVGRGRTFGDIDRRLSEVLLGSPSHYDRNLYFTLSRSSSVGFAILTRLEHIGANGEVLPPEERWSLNKDVAQFSWADYWRKIFFGPTGRYRMLLFIVSSQNHEISHETADGGDIKHWLNTGHATLNPILVKHKASPKTRIELYVYEFAMDKGRLTLDADRVQGLKEITSEALPFTVHLKSLRFQTGGPQ